MTFQDRIAASALVGGVALTLATPWLVWLDSAAHRAIQDLRSCGLASGIHSIDVAVRAACALVLLALFGTHGRRALPLLWPLLAVALAGGVAGEVLKTVFERSRPNEAPGDLSGNAFPSGHVMNTTIVVVAIAMLARRLGSGRAALAGVAILGTLAVAAQAAYRVVNGSHWASDALVSALLGIAWMAGAEAAARRTSARGIVTAGVATGLAFGAFYALPSLRLRVPSALDRPASPAARLELGSPSAALAGRWSHGWREPVGGVSWLVGGEGGIVLPAGARGGRLRLTLRPPGSFEGARGCLRARVSFGDDEREITLLEGWREYHFAVPGGGGEGPIRVGVEALGDVRGRPGGAPGLLAVHDVLLE